MVDSSDIIFEKVNALKEESGMSFEEISIKSKVANGFTARPYEMRVYLF